MPNLSLFTLEYQIPRHHQICQLEIPLLGAHLLEMISLFVCVYFYVYAFLGEILMCRKLVAYKYRGCLLN